MSNASSQHGQADAIATDVPDSSHPVDSEVLLQGADPIIAE